MRIKQVKPKIEKNRQKNSRKRALKNEEKTVPHGCKITLRLDFYAVLLFERASSPILNFQGTIDVWWLYDDGGLTLLIPHLLAIPKSYLEGARLRIFTISTSSRTMEQEQRGMAALLSKFRIDYSDVYVIADIGKKPRQETMNTWQSVIDPFIAQDGSCPIGMTTKSELSAQRDKTYRQLRAGELLNEHSINADLIVM